MQLTLTVDSTGKMQMVKSGKKIDQLFESVMFLSDYAHDLSLPEVAEKLEDVLDSILHIEGRVDNEVVARLGKLGHRSIEAARAATTAKQRQLVAELHGQDRPVV